MIRVLVTGADGQLGKSVGQLASRFPEMDFVFQNSKELDITNISQVDTSFSKGRFGYCINCAAYTDVEKAEKNPESAFAVNAEGVKNVATACRVNQVVLLHISTDYVFDGKKTEPYRTSDVPNPINSYGASKLKGEKYVQEIMTNYFIIRTSWLYSDYGNNFYKTILQKAKTGKKLRVTNDQTGCPTHAHNLAKYLIESIATKRKDHGIHHFTDGQAMTWYGFAQKILHENELQKEVQLEKAKNYRTFAPRPKYSVLKSD